MANEVILEERKHRSTDGGAYLVVADDSDEMQAALSYAIDMVKRNNAHLAVAHIVENKGFSTWGNVDQMMKEELRSKAEKYVWSVAKKIHEKAGIYPSVHIRVGDTNAEIMNILEDKNNDVRSLILASDVSGSGPGRLVTYFATKVSGKMSVPLIIVPGAELAKKEDTDKDEEKSA